MTTKKTHEEITVKIEGAAGAGKTTVAAIIRDALVAKGFKKICFQDVDRGAFYPDLAAARLAAVKTRPVSIETIQLPMPKKEEPVAIIRETTGVSGKVGHATCGDDDCG